jgi:hypothetical protein
VSDHTFCNRCGARIEHHWRWNLRHAILCVPCEKLVEELSPRFKELNVVAKKTVKLFDGLRRAELIPSDVLQAGLSQLYSEMRAEIKKVAPPHKPTDDIDWLPR